MRNGAASPLPLPVLIAHKNPCVLDSLSSLVRNAIPGITLILSSSHSYTMHCLTNARYQVVVCGVQFAEVSNFLLLRQHRAFQSLVPFIVIAEAQESALAKCALEQQSIEDIIVWPLHKGQVEESLRETMCIYQMRVTIAHRKLTLHTLQSWQSLTPVEKLPGDGIYKRILPSKQSMRTYQRTIQRIESNLKDLTSMVNEWEKQSRMRAVEHLELLGRGGS